MSRGETRGLGRVDAIKIRVAERMIWPIAAGQSFDNIGEYGLCQKCAEICAANVSPAFARCNQQKCRSQYQPDPTAKAPRDIAEGGDANHVFARYADSAINWYITPEDDSSNRNDGRGNASYLAPDIIFRAGLFRRIVN